MNLWKRIKKLSLTQLAKMGWIFLKRPLLILPTLRATKNTFEICNRLYGSTHHKNNKANAFRHALWNVLICMESIKRLKTAQKSIIWAQKVTNLYEKVTKNTNLELQMDLHNNEVGRRAFLTNFDKSEREIIDFIQNKVTNAQNLTQIEDLEKYQDQLIYISE